MLFYSIPDGKELWSSEKFEMTEANGQLFVPELDALFIVGLTAEKECLTAFVNIFPVIPSGRRQNCLAEGVKSRPQCLKRIKLPGS